MIRIGTKGRRLFVGMYLLGFSSGCFESIREIVAKIRAKQQLVTAVDEPRR